MKTEDLAGALIVLALILGGACLCERARVPDKSKHSLLGFAMFGAGIGLVLLHVAHSLGLF